MGQDTGFKSTYPGTDQIQIIFVYLKGIAYLSICKRWLIKVKEWNVIKTPKRLSRGLQLQKQNRQEKRELKSRIRVRG